MMLIKLVTIISFKLISGELEILKSIFLSKIALRIGLNQLDLSDQTLEIQGFHKIISIIRNNQI